MKKIQNEKEEPQNEKVKELISYLEKRSREMRVEEEIFRREALGPYYREVAHSSKI